MSPGCEPLKRPVEDREISYLLQKREFHRKMP